MRLVELLVSEHVAQVQIHERGIEQQTVQQVEDAALKACANDRLKITKSKVVKAKFDGKAVMSASGKEDFCADYAKRATEFDQCAK